MSTTTNMTVRCEAKLHSKLKVQAAIERRKLWEIVEEALKQYLNKFEN